MSFSDFYFSERRLRFATRTLNIGGLLLGGNNPIRIQSMTNTDTNDTAATVAQCEKLARAGCELIRITAQGEREARNLAEIKKSLHAKGIYVPLIADIHFQPKAAEIAAAIVEKVRINPGNYTDRRSRPGQSFADKEYALELEYIAEKVSPLLSICREHGTAIRIGSNHGSLSHRIIDRYGDTPAGMVESALEFARICKAESFENLVISMKSSNVRVMIQATRLLVDRMIAEAMDYPIHLGVTEAGDGEDGIIKSAVGIGSLLQDGIGDTIRVSLTGDPLKEIPVAREIAALFNEIPAESIPDFSSFTINMPSSNTWPHPYNPAKRISIASGQLGGNNPVQVLGGNIEIPEILNEDNSSAAQLDKDWQNKSIVLSGTTRQMRLQLLGKGETDSNSPVVIQNGYTSTDPLKLQVKAAIEAGGILVDGIGDALYLTAPNLPEGTDCRTAFAILQATRSRITRTEFISCPSCGRTQFDIEDSLEKVKKATNHLVGLKIAVMGCIVNGPGEMADADYGYVGAGMGKITLYKGQEVIRRAVPEADAIDALVDLIRESGDWKETTPGR
ncbi:MAG: (E)-4-hydroxy-3-methylbut-2-enyl-diphosphate synthase [Bacteroidales bacterium]|nr:(E)-4-hydroxy-3-methylbut-2-enyl-diphosphate synthase [Bacteroidales bacterium]